MINFFKSLNAAQFGFRVSLNLGPAIDLSIGTRFPNFAPLVRRARVSGLTAKETAKMLQLIAQGADSSIIGGCARDEAINAAMSKMERNADLWEGRL